MTTGEFPRPGTPKAADSELSDGWYESEADRLLAGLPQELSVRLRDQMHEEGRDARGVYEYVADFVRRRREAISRTPRLDIIDPARVHTDLGGHEDRILLERAERDIQEIRNTITNPESVIGRGGVAFVSRSQAWPKVCYKVVHNNDLYLKGNSVRKESSFLGRLNDLRVEGVRTPHAYFISDSTDIIVIGMEAIAGYDIDDIVTRRPEVLYELRCRGFDIDVFFRKLESYVEKMHERGVYHLDLLGKNIMIDWETLDPRVIDFGRSEYFEFESDVPYQVEISDREFMKTAKRSLRDALENVAPMDKEYE